MADQPRFQPGDLVDVVFRRAVVESVHSSGRLVLVHVEEEFHGMSPDATDVEVTVVGRVERDKVTNGWRMHEATGEPFRSVPRGCTCPLNARTCPAHGAAGR